MKKILYILLLVVVAIVSSVATQQHTLYTLQVKDITRHDNEYTITAGHDNEWHTYTLYQRGLE